MRRPEARTLGNGREEIMRAKSVSWKAMFTGLSVLLMLALVGCAGPSGPSQESMIKILEPGQEYAGFLSDYSQLKADAVLGEEAQTYARADAEKNLHKYVAIIIDPIAVYVLTDADDSQMPDDDSVTLDDYFRYELIDAVADVFPVVDEPGPLVLRLRAAIVGVDIGAEVTGVADENEPLPRAIDIGKVGIELELLDSESGEQIAAMVDRAHLGAGAVVETKDFSKDEKYALAVEAFDGWADRLREFLDEAHRISEEDIRRAEKVIGRN